jgi:hypothetical protein
VKVYIITKIKKIVYNALNVYKHMRNDSIWFSDPILLKISYLYAYINFNGEKGKIELETIRTECRCVINTIAVVLITSYSGWL